MFGYAWKNKNWHRQEAVMLLEEQDCQEAKKLTINQRDYWFECHLLYIGLIQLHALS